MLERVTGLPAGVDGLRARGKITRADYELVLQPILEHARSQGRRIRLLYHFGPEFDGFTASGAWKDARLGLRFLRLFERCAIVSDVRWIRMAMRLIGTMTPCPVKIFGNREWQDALAWLTTPRPYRASRIGSSPRGGSWSSLIVHSPRTSDVTSWK